MPKGECFYSFLEPSQTLSVDRNTENQSVSAHIFFGRFPKCLYRLFSFLFPAVPTAELVKRVKELYHKRVSDVRFLIPVLTGLKKQEIIAVLPKLIKQSPSVVKEVFNRLLGCFHSKCIAYHLHCGKCLSLHSSECGFRRFLEPVVIIAQAGLQRELGTLRKPRRQRECQQTKGLLMCKTMAVHVRHKSLYISLPSSANNNVK